MRCFLCLLLVALSPVPCWMVCRCPATVTLTDRKFVAFVSLFLGRLIRVMLSEVVLDVEYVSMRLVEESPALGFLWTLRVSQRIALNI